MLGKLCFSAKRGKMYVISGGPYMERPHSHIGVRLAAEIDLPAEVVIPTRDFSVPDYNELMDGLWKTLGYMIGGKRVYVGCMGGRGRTGLFLAALAKLWGIQHPVHFVRKNYFEHAVETSEQAAFIKNLTFPLSLKAKVVIAKWKGLVHEGRWLNPDPKPNILFDNYSESR